MLRSENRLQFSQLVEKKKIPAGGVPEMIAEIREDIAFWLTQSFDSIKVTRGLYKRYCSFMFAAFYILTPQGRIGGFEELKFDQIADLYDEGSICSTTFKTGAKFGFQTFSTSEETKPLVQCYIANFRPFAVKRGKLGGQRSFKALWLDYDGNTLVSANIGRLVTCYWKKKTNTTTSSTICRALVETVAHKAHQDGDISTSQRDAINGVNGHTGQIAQDYYLFHDRKREAALAVEGFKKIIGAVSPNKEQSPSIAENEKDFNDNDIDIENGYDNDIVIDNGDFSADENTCIREDIEAEKVTPMADKSGDVHDDKSKSNASENVITDDTIVKENVVRDDTIVNTWAGFQSFLLRSDTKNVSLQPQFTHSFLSSPSPSILLPTPLPLAWGSSFTGGQPWVTNTSSQSPWAANTNTQSPWLTNTSSQSPWAANTNTQSPWLTNTSSQSNPNPNPNGTGGQPWVTNTSSQSPGQQWLKNTIRLDQHAFGSSLSGMTSRMFGENHPEYANNSKRVQFSTFEVNYVGNFCSKLARESPYLCSRMFAECLEAIKIDADAQKHFHPRHVESSERLRPALTAWERVHGKVL